MAISSPQCEIKIYEKHRLLFSMRFEGTLEIGRRQPLEPEPFGLVGIGPIKRLIISNVEDTTVSRRQAKFELLENGLFSVTNLSSNTGIGISSGECINPGASLLVSLPTVQVLK